MKTILKKNDCLEIIGNRLVEITGDGKWNKIDGNATVDLHFAHANEVLSSVMEKKIADDIWDTLIRLHELKPLHNKIFLKRRLYSLQMMESTLVTDHINNLNILFSQLTLTG